MQPAFEWDRACELPVAGRTSAARHASATGAHVAQRHYGVKCLRYVEVLMSVGEHGISDHAALTRLQGMGLRLAGVGSINSIRDGLGTFVEHTHQYDTTDFGSKRGRYRLSVDGRAWWALGRSRKGPRQEAETGGER